GVEGWVFHSLLAGKRTALVAPWDKSGPFPTYRRAAAKAAIVAYLEPKVVAEVLACTGKWCEISVKGYDGWIEQDQLWGVYTEEVLAGWKEEERLWGFSREDFLKKKGASRILLSSLPVWPRKSIP